MFERTGTFPSPEPDESEPHPCILRLQYPHLCPPTVLGIRIAFLPSEFPTKIIRAVTMVQEITFETKISHPQWLT